MNRNRNLPAQPAERTVRARRLEKRSLRNHFDDVDAIPGGQDPEEVAEVIAGVIVSLRPDVYTRPGAKASIDRYYAGLGADP